MPVLGKAKPEEERIEEESDVVVIVDNSVNNHIESSRRDVFSSMSSIVSSLKIAPRINLPVHD